MKRYLALVLMLLLTAVSVCGCIFNPPTEKAMESFVETQVPESAHCVSVRRENKNVWYTFKSDNRELTFEVVALKNDGYPGYWNRVEYDKAVREYYLKDVKEAASSCACFEGRKETDENNAFEFRSNSDEDTRKIAKAIAKCNKIVSDQLKYTPGADLTSSKIMRFRMQIVFGDQSKDDGKIYLLNGLDDEDAVYKAITTFVEKGN